MTSLVDDFDDSDEEEGPVASKKVAASVDVDDLDTNLFKSFSSNRRRSSQENGTTTKSKTANDDLDANLFNSSSSNRRKPSLEKKSETMATSVDFDDLDANLFNSFSSSRRRSSQEKNGKSVAKQPEPELVHKPQQERVKPQLKPPAAAQSRDDDLDDILDLLSSDTEAATPKPTKASSEGGMAAKQGKPITFGEGGKGQQQEGIKTPDRGAAKPLVKPSQSPAQITFDDGDDDDILSGLGLGNATPAPKAPPSKASSFTPHQAARGGGTPRSTERPAPPTPSGLDSGEGEEEAVQFGGYVPSMAEPSPNSASTARRRRESNGFLTQQSAASKSVRFSEELESEEPHSAPPKTRGGEEDKRVPPRAPRGNRAGFAPPSSDEDLEEISPPSRDFPLRDSPLPSQRSRASAHDEFSDSMLLGPQEEEPPKGGGEEAKLEHPIFPWQRGAGNRASAGRAPGHTPSPMASITPPVASSHEEYMAVPEVKGPVRAASRPRGKKPERGQTLPDAREVGGPNAGGGVPAEVREARGSIDRTGGWEPERGQLREARGSIDRTGGWEPDRGGQLREARGSIDRTGGWEPERGGQLVQELEKALEEAKAECARLQDLLNDSRKQVSEASERQRSLEDENKQHKEKVTEIEDSKRKMESELRESLEECKVNLYKVELERGQLQQQVETARNRHGEEVEALQKSHSLRVASLEESLARRESRWKEELELESGRWQEKLHQAEGEKTDAVLALRRKFDSLEVSKANEISRLQSVHRSTIDDVKREHEADRQHLIRMHNEEVEALKAAHSHSRMLAELNSKVEASTKDVGHLQAKLSDSHTKLLDERAQRNKSQEDHLRTLEERLVSQQATNDAERERLQSLVAKLENHVSQQTKGVEQERWQLQQQSTRLKVQQAAFQEERAAASSRLEEEREEFHATRERFLVEQQEILVRCYGEQSKVGAEKAQVGLLKKKVEERERRDAHMSNQLKEEMAQMSEDKESLDKQLEELRSERKALDSDKEKLEAFAAEIERRSKEIDELCKSSLELKEKGEKELMAAKKMKEDLSGQSECLQLQLAEMREKEQKLAADNISLAEQRRNSTTQITPSPVFAESAPLSHKEPLSEDRRRHHSGVENSLILTGLFDTQSRISRPTPHQSQSYSATVRESAVYPPLRESVTYSTYSPRASPTHVTVPDLGVRLRSLSVRPYLAQIENKKNLRDMVAAAERDKEDLEKECKFLASLEMSNINMS